MILQSATRGHTIFPNRNVGKESPYVDVMFIDCRNSANDQLLKLISCTDRSCAQTEISIGEKITIQDMNSKIVAVEAKAFFRAVCSFSDQTPLKLSTISNSDGVVSAISIGCRDVSDECQTIPIKAWDSYPGSIVIPKHKKTFSCSLGELKKGISRIEFAFGIGASNPNYEFVKIRKEGDSVVLVSGNGAVFARTSIPCTSINLDENCHYVPCRELKNAIACMDGITTDDEQIFVSFSKDSAAIRSGGFSMVTSLADSIVWPDENVVFNRESTHKVHSDLSSWDNVLEGIRAVFEHENSINELCTTTISCVPSNKLKLSTGKQYKSERSISCTGFESTSSAMPVIKCQSASLLHSVKNSYGCERIALEIDSGTFNGNPAPIIMRFSKSSTEEESKPFFETFFVQAQS